MKKYTISCGLWIGIILFAIFVSKYTNQQMQKKSDLKLDSNSEINIQDTTMLINQHKITVPQIDKSEQEIKKINFSIIEKLQTYIDEECNLDEYKYDVVYNDGKFLSILFQVDQYAKKYPHPMQNCFVLNIDIVNGTLLDNSNMIANKKELCDSIRNREFVLLDTKMVYNNMIYPEGYLEETSVRDLLEKINDNEIEVFLSKKGIGIVSSLPYACGSYAVFESSNFKNCKLDL